MKAIYKIILIGVATVLAASCDLNEKPYGFYSDDNFYNTPEEAESAVLYAYNAYTTLEYVRGIFYIGELPTEVCYVKPDEGMGTNELDIWNATSGNEMLQYFFKASYVAINRANSVLDNVPNSPIDDAVKTKILGEAHFLRAHSYFGLMRIFGLVPMQLETVKMRAQTQPFLARDMNELYTLIMNDLKEAEKIPIPRRLDITTTGRVNGVAAWALAAKLNLHVASSKESGVALYTAMPESADYYYNLAKEYAGKVVNNPQQTTYGHDPDLMHIYNVAASTGREHIFLLSMDKSGTREGQFSKLGQFFLYGPSTFWLKLPDDSFKKIQPGWGVFRTPKAWYDALGNVDMRKTWLMAYDFYSDTTATVIADPPNNPGYAFSLKYVDDEREGDKESSKPFLLRYSDIALVYAEAAGPGDPKSYELVNEIRRRAGLSDLTPGMSLTQFRDAVIEERKIELAFEGNRLYDLRRKARVVQTVQEAFNAGLTDAECAFYPIPQLEIDLNPNI